MVYQNQTIRLEDVQMNSHHMTVKQAETKAACRSLLISRSDTSLWDSFICLPQKKADMLSSAGSVPVFLLRVFHVAGVM